MPARLPVTEAAHVLGLAPLAWCAIRGERRAAPWAVAAVLGVSFAADTAAHWLHPDVVGNTYPFLQAALLALVLLDWETAPLVAAVLGIVAVVAMFVEGPTGFDWLLRSAAWGCIVVMTRRWAHPLRWTLRVTFGGGLAAWFVYICAPSWSTWGLYQATRLLGVLAFIFASIALARPSSTSSASWEAGRS